MPNALLRKFWSLLVSVLLTLLGAAPSQATEPGVIPNPLSIQRSSGSFAIDSTVVIRVPTDDAELQAAGAYLNWLIERGQGVLLKVQTQRSTGREIRLQRSRGNRDAESYRLQISASHIRVRAPSRLGILHAARSLEQLIQRDPQGVLSVAALRIDDAPQFAWRGLMLDSARHYQSPAFIRDFIDWMALHKLNVLHWHLTDDQAWRLQIRKYPRLTEVGAWRVPAGRAAAADLDAERGMPNKYGGYYSQQDVRAIVAHATSRGIRIVPEIEMPGHASAALAAYPQYAALAQPPVEVPADWGVYPHVYDVDDATFGFLQDVLDEVMELFPGEWIHVGGDEVMTAEWAGSAQAQQRMRDLGISDPAGLQAYFTQRIGRYLKSKGRRLVGWDEILEPGLDQDAIVMSWRGVAGALAATARGHDSVLSPHPLLYLDNRQGTGSDEPPGRLHTVRLEDIYRFDPLPAALTADQRRHLLGIQGNIWTEHIRTEERVGWMTFPRAAAIAELGWSAPARRDWKDFLSRVPNLLQRYQAFAIPHADSAFAVQAETRYLDQGGRAEVSLTSQSGFGEIRYTLDGSAPQADSTLYRDALALTLRAQLRANSFLGAQALARARQFELASSVQQRRSSAELRRCTEAIALALEDESPLRGERAIFHLDIQNPCWIFPQARLDRVARIVAEVGDVPFNFQIGKARDAIRFAAPKTADGELLVHLDHCEGELIARIPLAALGASAPATQVVEADLNAPGGHHDLCLRFAQLAIDPMRTLDWVQLLDREPTGERRP